MDGEGLSAAAGADGTNVRPLVVDVGSEESVVAAARVVVEAVGGSGLAGLVNNAGISVNGPIEVLSREDWRRQLACMSPCR